MRNFTLVLISLLALADSGCDRQVQRAPTTTTTPSLKSQQDLDNVARCFFASVELLQSSPEHPQEYASFLAQGKLAASKSNHPFDDANFDRLRWSLDESALLTTSDDRIECRVVSQEHDHFGREGSAWIIEYEFYIEGTTFSSLATVQLHMK